MGIVNLTDDSFYPGSRYGSSPDTVLKVVERMVAEGADIIDLGPWSSHPGNQSIGPEEEWKRLEPVLGPIRKEFPELPISVDTCYSSVIEHAADTAGSVIANDISAGEADPGMLPAVGRLGLTYIAMHMRGNPATMQSMTNYGGDVTSAVLSYFMDFSLRAREAGIEDWILDPGFGFAKTVEQNYDLLSSLDKFLVLDRPILVGLSRKSMIYKMLGLTPEECLPATQVLNFAALQKGANILRVHDVAEAVNTVKLYGMLKERQVSPLL